MIPHPWLHRFARLTAFATFVLIVAGALVTSNRAGLAVPDWPTTYGSFMFFFPISKMVGNILYEHGHRLIASLVGLLTIVLAVWLVRREPRRGLRRLGIVALAAVIAQGILGGLTVRYFLPPAVSVAHAALAQGFFCLTVALALFTSARWAPGVARTPSAAAPLLRLLSVITTVAIYLQLLLGAAVRHANVGLAAHVGLAGLVVLAVCGVGLVVFGRVRQPALVANAATLLLLVGVQVGLGIVTWLVRVPKQEGGPVNALQVIFPTLHLAVGALILATSFALTLRAYWFLSGPPVRTRVPLRAWLELVKPRIVSMVLVTTTIGFFLADKGLQAWGTLLVTLLGTGATAGGAAVLNNYLEREIDAKMERTRHRALPTGQIAPVRALSLGILLVLAGVILLVWRVNLLAVFLGLLAAFLYVVVYTPMKRLTWLNTAVGAIPGAIPPLTGWAAATGQLRPGAWVLFVILFAWQHPHFYAIAWMFRDDYRNAGLKMLPVIDPSGITTFRQILLFSVLLLGASVLPTVLGLTGRLYCSGAVVLGLGLLAVGRLLAASKTCGDARRLLQASVIYLPILLVLIVIDAGFDPATVAERTAMNDSIVVVDGLTHRYGQRTALDGLSLVVPRGVIFGLLGPNGSGKTTLFRILSTLVRPRTGTVRLLGYEAVTERTAIRRRLGVVFQSPSLDKKLTVDENLRHQGHLHGLHGRALQQRMAELLDRFRLRERAGDLVETLSGGLRRRVELAKGLLHRPELLVLDEPSTGLDPRARRELGEYLQQLRDQDRVTILLTTHIMEEADRCDQLAILDGGRLVARDTPAALKEHIGGDVIIVDTKHPAELCEQINARFGLAATVLNDRVRLERQQGHRFITQLVEAFPGQIEAISVGKPTLEDVFIDLTGHRFEGEEK